MSGFITYITTAFALILVIEGLLYALFPDTMRRMMAMAIMQPVPRLRLFGIVLTVTGFCMVWILQRTTS